MRCEPAASRASLIIPCTTIAPEIVCPAPGAAIEIRADGLGEGVELASGEGLALCVFVCAKDADLATNGLGGVAIIASNDDNSDSGFTAFLDGACNLRTWRIKHADEADQGHIALQLGVLFGRLGSMQKRIRGDVTNGGEGNDTKTPVTAFHYLFRDQTGYSAANSAARGVCSAVVDNGMVVDVVSLYGFKINSCSELIDEATSAVCDCLSALCDF